MAVQTYTTDSRVRMCKQADMGGVINYSTYNWDTLTRFTDKAGTNTTNLGILFPNVLKPNNLTGVSLSIPYMNKSLTYTVFVYGAKYFGYKTDWSAPDINDMRTAGLSGGTAPFISLSLTSPASSWQGGVNISNLYNSSFGTIVSSDANMVNAVAEILNDSRFASGMTLALIIVPGSSWPNPAIYFRTPYYDGVSSVNGPGPSITLTADSFQPIEPVLAKSYKDIGFNRSLNLNFNQGVR
jgi:hypothetical protein